MHINTNKGWLDLKSTLFKTLIQNSGCFVAGHFHSSIQKWRWANVYLRQMNSVQSKTQAQDTIFYALTHLLKIGVAAGLKELDKMPKHYLMAWMLKYYIGQIHLYFLSQRRAVFVRLCGMIKHRERQTRTLFLQANTTHSDMTYLRLLWQNTWEMQVVTAVGPEKIPFFFDICSALGSCGLLIISVDLSGVIQSQQTGFLLETFFTNERWVSYFLVYQETTLQMG